MNINHLINNNSLQISFTDNVNEVLNRQNVIIKLMENPNILKYYNIIQQIKLINEETKTLIGNLDLSNVYYGLNILNNTFLLNLKYKYNAYSTVIFIAIIIVTFVYHKIIKNMELSTLTNLFRELWLTFYNYYVTLITRDTTTKKVLCYSATGFIIIYILALLKNSISDYIQNFKLNTKLKRICKNIVLTLSLSKKIINKKIAKNKGLVKIVDLTLHDFKNMSIPKLLNSKQGYSKNIQLIYDHINYVSDFINISLNLKNKNIQYFFPNIVEGEWLVIPQTEYGNYASYISNNCIIVDKKYPLIESIRMHQTIGISLINNMKSVIFSSINEIVDVEDSSKYENCLLIIKNVDLNMNTKYLLSVTNKSNNFFILSV
jgi:hypothetical protein